MKKKPKFLLIEKTIFPYDILVCFSSFDECVKRIKKTGYELCEEEKDKLEMDGVGRTVMLRGGQTIIRLPRKKTSFGIDVADLSHEISHAVFFICDKIGIKHTGESDEVFAYYQGYIMREVLRYFQKN